MPVPIQLKAVSPQQTVSVNADLNHSIEKEESYSHESAFRAKVKLEDKWQNPDETYGKTKSDESSQPKLSHNFLRIPVHPNATPFIQPKLVVNTPGDMYEQEADEVAEKVMQMQVAGIDAVQPSPITRVHRKCTTCGKEEEVEQDEKEDMENEPVQRTIMRTCAACEAEGQPEENNDSKQEQLPGKLCVHAHRARSKKKRMKIKLMGK